MLVKSAEEMHTLAESIAKKLEGGEVLLLTGPLGAGKTTFVQGLAKALGVQEQVTSPTFTVVGEYKLPKRKTLVHVDLYRLAETAPSDPAVLDVLEQAGDPGRITVIEWAEFLPNMSGRKIVFDYGDAIDERVVTIL